MCSCSAGGRLVHNFKLGLRLRLRLGLRGIGNLHNRNPNVRDDAVAHFDHGPPAIVEGWRTLMLIQDEATAMDSDDRGKIAAPPRSAQPQRAHGGVRRSVGSYCRQRCRSMRKPLRQRPARPQALPVEGARCFMRSSREGRRRSRPQRKKRRMILWRFGSQ